MSADALTSVDITMPRFSDSMEEGTIIKWLIDEGHWVDIGDEIADIETEKTSASLIAEEAGVLRIVVAEGSRCEVGTVIGKLAEEPLTAMTASPEKNKDDAEHPTPTSEDLTGAPGSISSRQNNITPVAATPLARRTAVLHSVELDGLIGSGPHHRITRGDVLQAAGVAPERTAVIPLAPQPQTLRAAKRATVGNEKGEDIRQELTRMQAVVAQRMAESKTTVPHFQIQAEVVVDELIAFRNELLGIDRAEAPTINDLIIKASALALREHPLANGSFRDGAFILHGQINVGFAVSAEDALFVPTVFDADISSIGAIARETRRLADSVKSGQATPAELSGGTFTVSNLGMYGMSAIYPVINAPQAAILGVGSARKAVTVAEDGAFAARTEMTLTLSCDHRILYGADAAQFLSTLRSLLEQPLRLAL